MQSPGPVKALSPVRCGCLQSPQHQPVGSRAGARMASSTVSICNISYCCAACKGLCNRLHHDYIVVQTIKNLGLKKYMTQSPEYRPTIQSRAAGNLVKVAPKAPPTLIENWVVWEYTACLYTNGLKLDTGDLHDLLKAELEQQKIPVNIFFSTNASWVIEGARGTAKVDNDRRARVVATLMDSPYTDIQFITGLDYFGDYWVNFQMMLIVQPEKLEDPPRPALLPRPTRPQEPNLSPLIPNEALVVMALVAIALIFSGNPGLQMLGGIGFLGGVGIWSKSTVDVRQAKQNYDRQMATYRENEKNLDLQEKRAEEDWKRKLEKIALEREELQKNRLSRSFKWDDLIVFHEVMNVSVAKIIHTHLIKQGATVKETKELNKSEDIIPKSKKDIFDTF